MPRCIIWGNRATPLEEIRCAVAFGGAATSTHPFPSPPENYCFLLLPRFRINFESRVLRERERISNERLIRGAKENIYK